VNGVDVYNAAGGLALAEGETEHAGVDCAASIGASAIGDGPRMSYYLLHTTYLVLFLSVCANQLCLPVPSILFLLSAGALAGTGGLSFTGIVLVAILGCLLGDLVWFEAGRLRGKQVLRLLCALASDPIYCIRRSRTAFAGSGLKVLLIAKFVPGLDGISPPLAGMSGASRWKFLIYDAGGSALWAGTYAGAGYLFAAELDKMAQYITVSANALILVLGVPLLFFFVWKLAQLVRMIVRLQHLYITPEELKARLDGGEKTVLIDLLRFDEDDPEDLMAIPGALRADPEAVRYRTRLVVPEGIDLVLYCGSKNSFVSARAAAHLRKRGVGQIRVLTGGLTAWKEHGFPLGNVITDLAERIAAMQQLGVEGIPPPRSAPPAEVGPASD